MSDKLVMAVNAGSSSLKYKLYRLEGLEVVCGGLVDRIGHEDGIFKLTYNGETTKEVLPIMDHHKGVELIPNALTSKGIVKDKNDIVAIGHRVVQGGKYFSKSALFDADTEKKIADLTPLDPLHAPAHLMGFHAFKEAIPGAVAIAVFDTAYHQTMEEEDYLFPIPYELSEKYDCRRYGAHGTSHRYLAEKALATYLKGKEDTKIITCHLGSGSSLAAIHNGKVVATSMGLTPLGGVMMGTRSGDLDPSVSYYLAEQMHLSNQEVYDLLNKKSGFLGVTGLSNDTRDVEDGYLKGDKRCIIASHLFARRVADYIGQYFVRLGGVDLIIFSAGIGENSAFYRKLVLDRVKDALHIVIDEKKNEEAFGGREELISAPESAVKVAVIPTDEEKMIASDAVKAYEGKL